MHIQLIRKLILNNIIGMRRSKIKQQLVYFPKNIRKNIIQRPNTTQHKRYFTSKEYKFVTDRSKISGGNTSSFLELNNSKYFNSGDTGRKINTQAFLEAYRIQRHRENKIKENVIEGRINFNPESYTMQSFVNALIDSNVFFQKLEKTMVESLILIATQKKYQKGEKLQGNNKCIGFVLYGKMKIYDQDFTYMAHRGDTLGENELFQCHRELKLKILEDSAVLWVPINSLNILREQTIRQGYRREFNRIQTQLKINFVRKKFPKF